MNPKDFFDQFTETVTLRGGMIYPPSEWPALGQWCARHWGPCPVLDYNGIGAAVEVQKIWLEELCPSGIPDGNYDALNVALQKAGHICCTLGDDRMYELWANWEPGTTVDA